MYTGTISSKTGTLSFTFLILKAFSKSNKSIGHRISLVFTSKEKKDEIKSDQLVRLWLSSKYHVKKSEKAFYIWIDLIIERG